MKHLNKYRMLLVIMLAIPICFVHAKNKKDDKRVIFEKSAPIQPGKKLIVDVEGGDIIITPWDKSEFYIKVTGNKKAAEYYKFDFKGNDEEIIITADKDGWSWFSNISLKIEIKVPKEFNVNTNTSGGDVKIAGIKGNLSLKTSGGDIWGDRIEGDLYAKTSGGDINIFCNDAKIEANTSGGDIEIEYTGTNRGIELKTSGGDIDVNIPNDFSAAAELKTSGGDVTCRLKLNNVKTLSETKIIGDINKGGAPLTAYTSGGDITIFNK